MKHRIERVCEVLKRELGLVMLRELSFPAPLVTVNAVDVTPDLKQAHIFISALGTDAERRKTIEVLEHSRVMLQQEVSKRVAFKNTPHLHFRLDDSIERGSRVLGILDEIEQEEEK
jgi:ribosome-binding factor A